MTHWTTALSERLTTALTALGIDPEAATIDGWGNVTIKLAELEKAVADHDLRGSRYRGKE